MKNFLSLIFIFSGIMALAQTKQDVLYLKNGGVFRGTIIPSFDSSVVKIEILGGSVFVVKKSEIASAEKQDIPDLQFKAAVVPQTNGWFNELSFGLPMGANTWGAFTSGVTFNYILGYQYRRILKFGLGTGIDYYDYNATMLPLFARVTGDLTNKNISPFYVADIGFGNNVTYAEATENYKGGFMMYLGGGFKFNTRSSVYVNLSCGFKTQYSSSNYFGAWLEKPYTEYRQFNRIESRISVGF